MEKHHSAWPKIAAFLSDIPDMKGVRWKVGDYGCSLDLADTKNRRVARIENAVTQDGKPSAKLKKHLAEAIRAIKSKD
jgi:hypothetical protein